jgi:hypothetical protein
MRGGACQPVEIGHYQARLIEARRRDPRPGSWIDTAAGAPPGFACAKIASVKLLLKSYLVWFMLLAVPLQGYASATTLLCAPLENASRTMGLLKTPAPGLDHQAMLAARHAGQTHADGAEPSAHRSDASGKTSSSHDAGGKCNTCSTCCFGAAMVASHATRMPVEPQQFTVIPFAPGSVPAVDLALPERPPQTSLT